MSKKPSKMILIKRYLSYFYKGTKLVVLSSVMAFLFSFLSMLIPYYAGVAIDHISDIKSVTIYLIVIAVLVLFSSISHLLLLRINNKISLDAIMYIRNDLYKKVCKVPICVLDRTNPGFVQSLIINDVETVSDGTILFLNQFVSGLVSIFFTLLILLYINWKIALFVLVFTPLSFVISNFISKKTFNAFKEQSNVRAVTTSFINEMTSNFRESKLFNITDQNKKSFKEINDKYKEISSKATFYSSITNPSTRFVNSIIYAFVALFGSFFILAGSLTVGALSSVLAYANQFMKPFNDLSSVYTEISDCLACLERIFEFLDLEEIDDDLTINQSDDIYDRNTKFTIEFKDVCFSYVPGKPVLSNINLKIEAGQSVAFVGPTGCGKTTMINLLMRYYEIDSGDILINDKSIYDMSRNELRKYIGFIPQDTWFKDASVIDNITFGNPNLGMEDVIKYSIKTDADSFIRKFPDKYNERLEQSRDDISEGQRQLLSITRAIASDSSIMILDEATSSVDVLTEVKIQKAVKEVLNGRTGIIIAHRLSTIIDCDNIVVFNNGKIVQSGNHQELLASGGFYSSLYSSYIK